MKTWISLAVVACVASVIVAIMFFPACRARSVQSLPSDSSIPSIPSIPSLPSIPHYFHQTTASEADIRNDLGPTVENHPRLKAIMARQVGEKEREQRPFFYIIKGKSILAEIGQEWPDEKPGWLDTRLTDDEIKEIGEVVYEVVKSRPHLKGELIFQAVKKNREVIIYRRDL